MNIELSKVRTSQKTKKHYHRLLALFTTFCQKKKALFTTCSEIKNSISFHFSHRITLLFVVIIV